MPRPLPTYRIDQFAGLVDAPGVELEPGQATVLQNLYVERGRLKRRGGTARVGAHDLPTAQSHDGLFWSKIGTTETLFAAHNGSVYDWLHAIPGNLVANSAGRVTAGSPATFAWLDSNVYVGDGLKQNSRIDLTSLAMAMPAPPAAVPNALEASTGSGVLANGTYLYKLVYLSYDGNETEPKAFSATIGGGPSNVYINLASYPTDEDIAGFRVYRLPSGGTVYKLVGTSASVSGSVTDNVLDANLGAALSTQDRTRFPGCRLLEEHQGRLMGAGSSTAAGGDAQTLYLSNYREPWYCPLIPDLDDPNQGTRIALQDEAAGEITALKSHGDRLFVWTYGAAYILTGDDPLDFSLRLWSEVGCVSHKTVCSHRAWLIWLAADGVYASRAGAEIERISDDLEGTFKAFTTEELGAAHAFSWDEKYFLMLAGTCYWFDLRALVWGQNTAWDWACSTVTRFQTTSAQRIYAGKTDLGRAYQLETGTDDDGDPIETSFVTGDLHLGSPGREKRLHYMGAAWKTGEGTATISLYKGGAPTPIQTTTQDLAGAVETGGSLVRLDQRCAEQARAEYFRLKVAYGGTATSYELNCVDFKWQLVT